MTLQQPSTPRRISIIDATLREGAQTPGVSFTVEDSAEIAAAVAAIGVDMIECGHPAAGEDQRDRIAAARAATDLPILAHARARRGDVRAAADAGAAWVGIFIGVNEVSRRARLSRRVAQDPTRHLVEAISEAKDLGLAARFTVEDASRTSAPELIDAFGAAIDAGADRICWADTVGVRAPAEVADATRLLRRTFADTPLELHLHDDRGLALANALAGAEAGADWIAATVNGVGERCGIVDTLQLLINLRLQGMTSNDPDGEAIAAARDIVARATGMPISPQRALTGEHAFTHTSALHRQAMQRDGATYEAINPDWLGARPKGRE